MRAFRLLKKLMPSSGGGDDFEKAKKSIRLARYGCANRPFYHIVVVLVSIIILNSKYFVYNIKTFVFQQRRDCKSHPIEQLGTYDPMENHYGEKLVSFNLERIKYWMAKKARLSNPVAELLGMYVIVNSTKFVNQVSQVLL